MQFSTAIALFQPYSSLTGKTVLPFDPALSYKAGDEFLHDDTRYRAITSLLPSAFVYDPAKHEIVIHHVSAQNLEALDVEQYADAPLASTMPDKYMRVLGEDALYHSVAGVWVKQGDLVPVIEVPTYADLPAAYDTSHKVGSQIYYVVDATGDPDVQSGGATYRLISATPTFEKLSESDSPDFFAQTAGGYLINLQVSGVTSTIGYIGEAKLLLGNESTLYAALEHNATQATLRTGVDKFRVQFNDKYADLERNDTNTRVVASNGNDVNGIGSVIAPYASVQRALSDLTGAGSVIVKGTYAKTGETVTQTQDNQLIESEIIIPGGALFQLGTVNNDGKDRLHLGSLYISTELSITGGTAHKLFNLSCSNAANFNFALDNGGWMSMSNCDLSGRTITLPALPPGRTASLYMLQCANFNLVINNGWFVASGSDFNGNVTVNPGGLWSCPNALGRVTVNAGGVDVSKTGTYVEALSIPDAIGLYVINYEPAGDFIDIRGEQVKKGDGFLVLQLTGAAAVGLRVFAYETTNTVIVGGRTWDKDGVGGWQGTALSDELFSRDITNTPFNLTVEELGSEEQFYTVQPQSSVLAPEVDFFQTFTTTKDGSLTRIGFLVRVYSTPYTIANLSLSEGENATTQLYDFGQITIDAAQAGETAGTQVMRYYDLPTPVPVVTTNVYRLDFSVPFVGNQLVLSVSPSSVDNKISIANFSMILDLIGVTGSGAVRDAIRIYEDKVVAVDDLDQEKQISIDGTILTATLNIPDLANGQGYTEKISMIGMLQDAYYNYKATGSIPDGIDITYRNVDDGLIVFYRVVDGNAHPATNLNISAKKI